MPAGRGWRKSGIGHSGVLEKEIKIEGGNI
jgi:hypothetical protein